MQHCCAVTAAAAHRQMSYRGRVVQKFPSGRHFAPVHSSYSEWEVLNFVP